MRRKALLVVLLAAASPTVWAAADSPATVACDASGQLELRMDPRRLEQLGLRPTQRLGPDATWSLPIAASGFAVERADGAPTGFGAGRIEVPSLGFVRADGARTPTLHFEAGDGLALELRDDAGRTWLRVGHAMRSPDPRDGLRFFSAETRVGPALAAWLGRPIDGELFAGTSLQLPLPSAKGAIGAKSCSIPNWPGTPGYVADVILTNIDTVQVQPGRCRNLGAPASPCDGPGGNEGELVIVPAATLHNRSDADAAEIPWYTKFSGTFPPYGNDQHPYLVWNLYRLDAEGRFEQIARSGLKHAFATANFGCVEPCLNAHILGRGCGDLYDATSNDCASFLAPRRDVIPSRGVWGRCGSIHDPDCDGVQSAPAGFCSAPFSSPAGDGYSYRLVARESAIDPAANAGARFLLDAWYVVRDDVDPFNTMGWREIFPAFQSGSWNTGAATPFVQGSPLDQWLAAAPAGTERARLVVTSSEGRALIGVRVQRLPDQRYRYDYAMMNLDFSRPVIEPGSVEPNLRLIRNLGFGGFELDLRNAAAIDSVEYRDGDASAANDWPLTPGAASLSGAAPAGATLEWGQLVFLRVVSPAAPGTGQLRLMIAEAGLPAQLEMLLPVPDGAQLFRDSFE